VENPIHVRHGTQHVRDAVMRLDLRREGVPFQTKALDEGRAERCPVPGGVGGDVGRKSSGGTAEFCRELGLGNHRRDSV